MVADVAGVCRAAIGVGHLGRGVVGVRGGEFNGAVEGVGPDNVVCSLVFGADLVVGVVLAGVVVNQVVVGGVAQADAAAGVLVAGILLDGVVRCRAAEVDAVITAGAVVAGDDAVIEADDLDPRDVLVRRAADCKPFDGCAVGVDVENRLVGGRSRDGDGIGTVLGADDEQFVHQDVLGVGTVLHDDGVAHGRCRDRIGDGGEVRTPVVVDVPGRRLLHRRCDTAVLPRSRQGCMVGAEAVREDVRGVDDPVAVGVVAGVIRPEVAGVAGVLRALVGVSDRGGGVPVGGGRGGAVRVKNSTRYIVVQVEPVSVAGVIEADGGATKRVPGNNVVGCRCLP